MPLLRLTLRPLPRFSPYALRLQSSQTQFVSHTRSLSNTSSRHNDNDADKKSNLFDKDAINTSSNEYSKSGGDAEVAHTDAAFDPGNTAPESQHKSVEEEQGGPANSVDASPANKDISSPGESNNQRTEGSPMQDKGGRKSSGGGSPRKGTSAKA